MKNVLITGGSGFVGTTLVQKLLAAGKFTPINIDINKPQLKSQNQFWTKADIRSSPNLSRIFRQVRPYAVIHLAAKHYIPWCDEHPVETVHTNVAGTQNVLTAAKEHKVQRFILASSAAVYGAYNTPCKETFKLTPNNIYGVTKVVNEGQTKDIFPTAHIARFFNIIGPQDKTSHLFPEIISQLKSSGKVKLGNTASVRDYIHVNDICAMLIALLDIKTPQIVNMGTGNGKTALDLVAIAAKDLGIRSSISIDNKRKRAIDTPLLVANTNKMAKLFKNVYLTPEAEWCYNI